MQVAFNLIKSSISLMLGLIEPHSSAVTVLFLILKNLSQNIPSSILELKVTNAILQDMVDAYREVKTKAMIANITKSSIVIDESSNHILEAFFFYMRNNMVVNQLKGSTYFAYDSISKLFKGVYCWNAFLEEAAKSLKSLESQTKRKQIINRRTIIYFLHTHPPTNITMLEFTEI
jgi:hypothetical protein